MASVKAFTLLAALLALVASCQGVHFYLEQANPRCILEDLPSQTVVVGQYTAQVFNGQEYVTNPGVGITVNATEKASGHVVLSMRGGHEGRFAFTTAESGEHQICLRSNYTAWLRTNVKTKLYLTLTIGESNNDSAVKKDKLGDMALQVRGLNNRVTDIRREQQYQKEQEEKFRDTSESVNSRVVWFLLLQITVFIVASAWQLTHLRNFFKSKKVV